jgi:hypothetical protein
MASSASSGGHPIRPISVVGIILPDIAGWLGEVMVYVQWSSS